VNDLIHAQAVRDRGVLPLLDVVAAGHTEGLLIANFATPERDSLLEILPAVVDRSHPLARQTFEITKRVYTVNGDQTDDAKGVLGYVDGIATVLERKPSGSQKLAKALRPHLATLADRDANLREVAAAFREVERITAGVSREQLTSPALQHQLGRKRFAVLQDVIAEDRS
jgi:hypothetical protein